jgi:NodT family efflux transporter outer membrane factor (OMF) lipoprotein
MVTTCRHATKRRSGRRAWEVPVRFTILTALLLSVSCGLRKPAVDPTVAVPPEFSSSGSSPAAERWWTALGDSSLNTLMEEALDSNLTLRAAFHRLDQAHAVAKRERASRFPTGTIGADAEARDGSGSVQSNTELSLFFAASYELDLWGRVRASRDAAAFDALASVDDTRTATISVSGRVATTWYRIIEQRTQIDLLQSQLGYGEIILELVTLRFRQGKARAEDVLQQRQAVESRRGEIAHAEAERAVLEHELAVLLGRLPTDTIDTNLYRSGFPHLPPIPDTGLPFDLIQRRPDVRSAYHRVHAADQRVAAAIADRFPRISITGRAATRDTDAGVLFDNWLASIAGNVALPVFDGGRRRAEVARAQFAVLERLTEYRQVVLGALREVEDALVRERQQAQYIASLRLQIVLSTLVIERSRDSYTRGAADYLRVLAAQQTHETLQRAYITALSNQFQNHIALHRSLSGGWTAARDDMLTHVEHDPLRPESQGE